ncbi:MAG: hypothetical protein GTN62_02805 [Gemmatimonadales bacterium]|nr:hypothetical protein [Gemmatimonadales bacterium]NIN10701.1 hypothetical protein [Gemmatimonadales bacterium]NIN49029.1 hypothetical protein [Gemmatimonadales bacterium]NIP06493.1 hypothetical protein [Gemmatimonadales bacterium]NIQ98838.1 hypothetical protein [Gemmatimonadales bacterium]
MRAKWLLLPALVMGCASTTEPVLTGAFAAAPGLGQPFALKVGEWARIDEADLLVRFVEVVSDSRCPSNALILCLWEGDGAVLVEIAPQDGDALLDTLHTALDPKAVDLGAVTLELRRLDPYPWDVTPIPVEDYLATFVVESRS